MKCPKRQGVFLLLIRKTNLYMQDLLDYYETWKGQKELEEFVKKRELNRPSITKFSVFVLCITFTALLFAPLIIILIDSVNLLCKVIISFIYELTLFETFFRLIIIKIIKCYQHYALEETRRRCLCIPSCSEYAIAVFKRFLLIIAIIKVHKRLYKTCNGEIYVIDRPYKKYKIDLF